MARTIVGVGDPKAIKRWRTALAVQTTQMEYFTKFTSSGDNTIIQRLSELESEPGDQITFDLVMDLREDIVEGDQVAEGKEEALRYHTDSLYIDQARKPVSLGGRMSRKRTLHDIRRQARDRCSEFMAKWADQLKFVYLSSDTTVTAINSDSLVRRSFAGNAITAPDADHIFYGGSATSKATLAAGHKMQVDVIERASTRVKMMRTGNRELVTMKPVRIGAKEHYIHLISPNQSYSLRTTAGDLTWVQYQQAAAGAEGRNSPLFSDKMGMIGNVVIHEHPDIRIWDDYGAGADVQAARSLFMGRQAGVVAYGMTGSSRMYWEEEPKDYGNEVGILAGTICGFKKARFNNTDLAIVAIDTAAANA